MYDNTALRILEKIYLNPGIHKRGLSKELGLGMPSIDYSLKKIDFLLRKERSANQIKFYMDYSKDALTPSLACVEYSRLERLPSKIKLSVRDFLGELKPKPLLVIIFGSYARVDYTDESDIDILLVFQKQDNVKSIENAAKRVSMRANTNISPVYLDYDSFEKSFHDSRKDFFLNLKKNKIIMIGLEWWRLLENEKA